MLRKLLKLIFSIFFKKFNKPSIRFLRVWTKNATCRIFLRKFSEENCERIILAYFSKNLTNHAFKFCAFGRTTQFLGNFEKIFESFSKNFFKKFLKMHYFCIFLNKILQTALLFCAFGRKTQVIGIF